MLRQLLLLLAAWPLAATPLVTYAPGTILENIAIAPSGDLFATALDSGTIFRVSPSGSSQVFAQVPDALAGIALNTAGTLFAVGQTSIYRFAANGAVSLLVNIPGAQELNGLALFGPDKFLVADDQANTVWLVDAITGASQAWLTGPLLTPAPGGLPIGPNGIKLYQGSVYLSVTGADTILRIPILANGAAGTPQVYAASLAVDDFAFGADGSLFAAAQIGEITRVHPDGTRTTILTGTLGDAAVAFGRTAADRQFLYVVNNGGAFLGLPGGPEPASIVRLDAGINGVIPESQAVPEPATLSTAAVALVFLIPRKGQRKLCALLLGAALSANFLAAEPVFTQIDFPGAAVTQAWGLTPAGDIVGGYVNPDNSTHGFLWTNSEFRSIDFPGAAYTYVNGINARGDIVGQYAATANGSGPNHAFVLTRDGVFTTIDFPGAVYSAAIGINSRGDVAGSYTGADNLSHTYVRYADGAFQAIDDPAGATSSVVIGMRADDIVGGYPLGSARYGFVLSDGTYTTIEVPGASFTNVTGINALGQFVGRFTRDGVTHAYLLNGGQITSFDFPGATFTGTTAIGLNGDIVGRFQDANRLFHGFLLTGFRPAQPCASGQ